MEYTSQRFSAGQVLRASQLNAMDEAIKTSMRSALPVTVELSKAYHRHVQSLPDAIGDKGSGTRIVVTATGLDPNLQYRFQIFRFSKSRNDWVQLNSDNNPETAFGWACVKGTVRARNKQTGLNSFFTTAVPDWMPNNGVLQGKWEFTLDHETSKVLYINPKQWILDALKPSAADWDYDTGKVRLIGTRGKRYESLKFKVGVVCVPPSGPSQLVGLSKSVLSVYAEGGNSSVNGDCLSADSIGTRISY